MGKMSEESEPLPAIFPGAARGFFVIIFKNRKEER